MMVKRVSDSKGRKEVGNAATTSSAQKGAQEVRVGWRSLTITA